MDFWRGICLVMIFVNHIPDNLVSMFTLRNWGFSDAAEAFVFLAGFSAMLAFTRYFRDGGFLCGVLRVIKRIWQLFCAHVLLIFWLSTIIAIAGLFTDSKPIMEQLNFSPFFVETDTAILQLVKLQYMPSMTDILPIYIVFVAMFPVLWLLMKASPYAALAASFTLWLWANATGCTFASYPEGTKWFFNPLAWQFMFVSGATAYHVRERIAALLRSNILFALAALAALFGFVAAAPWIHYAPLSSYRVVPAEFLSLDDKSNLSALRIVHFFSIAFLAARLLPEGAGFWSTRLSSLVSTTGRHSLAVYCVGVALALAAHIFLRMNAASPAGTLLVNIFGIAILTGLAFSLEKASVILDLKRKPLPEKTIANCGAAV